MSMYGAYYRLRDTKQNEMAFAIHSDRILKGTIKAEFDERPGQTYLKYLPSWFKAEQFEFSLNLICEYYDLNPADSFRKSSKPQHYEIMGKLLNFYNHKFITRKAIESSVTWIGENSAEKSFERRPGQTYILFKDTEPTTIEEALKIVCDYHGLNYSDSFRQSSLRPDLYEIKGELLEIYKLHNSPEMAAQDSAITDSSSPSRIKCR